jgi:hypothetical protein
MNTDEKLAAILAVVQTDPGNRGLAKLFAYCPVDFAAACKSIAEHKAAKLAIVTGFLIPTAEPPMFETDGPLGTWFLERSLRPLGIRSCPVGEMPVFSSLSLLRRKAADEPPFRLTEATHLVFIERSGPARDGNHYTMRGLNIADELDECIAGVVRALGNASFPTIGIGDGGNEIGMGKIPHETIVKNIPNGDLIHCRVPTDHLIVAGVSNWGAYALAAGVYVLRGVKPPADLFDPDREREILEVIVREGPLVDGVTGKQTATVDGLTWEEYVKPLIRIREILES